MASLDASDDNLEPRIAPASFARAKPVRSRVLIVEDDPAFADFLAWTLVDRGYTVQTAGNIAEALAVLGTEQAFDVVLSDVALPGAPGTDLLFTQAIVARKTPVILMSGYGGSDLQAFVETCGGAFLSKPFKLDALFQCVSGHASSAGAP